MRWLLEIVFSLPSHCGHSFPHLSQRHRSHPTCSPGHEKCQIFRHRRLAAQRSEIGEHPAADFGRLKTTSHLTLVAPNLRRVCFFPTSQISEQPSSDPERDLYHHPEAMGEPLTSFTATMDIYSLSTVLLEIGEWRSLKSLAEKFVDVRKNGADN